MTTILKSIVILIISILLLGVFKNTTHAQEYHDGMLDPEFINGNLKGFQEYVFSSAVQEDQRILVGGEFKQYNGIDRKNILRLNSDGSLDTSFDPGTGVIGGGK